MPSADAAARYGRRCRCGCRCPLPIAVAVTVGRCLRRWRRRTRRTGNRYQAIILSGRERRFHAVLTQDPLDRVAADIVAEIAQRSSNPGIGPARVLGGEPDDELPHPCPRRRTTRGATAGAVVILGNELAVPAEDAVRRDDGVEA